MDMHIIEKLKVGDRIAVNANEVLGTDAAMGTVIEVRANCYEVHVDGDDPEWHGPVSFAGDVLCSMG